MGVARGKQGSGRGRFTSSFVWLAALARRAVAFRRPPSPSARPPRVATRPFRSTPVAATLAPATTSAPAPAPPHSSLHVDQDPAHSPSARSIFLFLLNLDSATFSPSRPQPSQLPLLRTWPTPRALPSQPLPSDRPALARGASPSGASGTLAGRPTPLALHEAREREPYLPSNFPRRTHSFLKIQDSSRARLDPAPQYPVVEGVELGDRVRARGQRWLRHRPAELLDFPGGHEGLHPGGVALVLAEQARLDPRRAREIELE